ncbi:hypothetical protein MMC24_004192 [Lignoscripta atroalba]|nr:hypothetical protein [Lignoscripta atroalba]
MSTTTARSRTDTDPKQRFFRYFQHEVTALQEQMGRLEDTALVGGERSDAIDHCLAGIARLSNEAIKALGEKLQETRAAFAPKQRFTFKTTTKNSSAISLTDAAELASAQRRHIPGYRSNPSSSAESSMATTPAYLASPPNEPSNNPSDVQTKNLDTIPESPGVARPQFVEGAAASLLDPRTAAIRKPSFASATSVAISSRNAVHIILPSSASHATSSGSLTNLKNSVIDMSVPTASGQPFAGLTIKNIKKSLLVCGSVNGAAHVTGVESSVIVVTTRQFRMHECKNCIVYLYCTSRPIIEDCNGIRFAPLPKAYSLPSLQPSGNQYNQVGDFKWLKAEHSPNWSILSQEDTVQEEVWRDIVPGGPGFSLDDILKTTGVMAL